MVNKQYMNSVLGEIYHPQSIKSLISTLPSPPKYDIDSGKFIFSDFRGSPVVCLSFSEVEDYIFFC